MFLMVCTMKDSNTLLTFCLFLIPHILPLTRYNVTTSRYKTHYICCTSFQFTTAYEGDWYLYCPCFLSPFSPICSVQDYIYSKYHMQLTQLNNNTYLKNLASNQIRRSRVRNPKFVFFFRFTRENVLGYFVSLLHEKMQIFGMRFRELLATLSIFDFLN